MEAILDTNFVISCIRKRIDFMTQLELQGFKVKIPHEVMDELKDLRTSNRVSHEDRIAIDVALQMFSRKEINKMKLGHGKVDDSLISLGKAGAYIATLDNGIKRQIPNKIVIFDAQKSVGPENR